jgi:hypothetical protein
MMHNSLLIRDRLLQTNNNELHKSRRDPHRSVRKLSTIYTVATGEIELTGGWAVKHEGDGPGLQEAAEDIREFLTKCGIDANVSTDCHIILRIDASIPSGGFQRAVDPHRIDIAASDMRGVWAGVVDLEKELSVRGAPVLTLGTVTRQPRWNAQISQAPFGSNYLLPDVSPQYLSDDAFRMLAHSGVNGMTIYGDWLLYVNSDTYPELNCPDYEQNIGILREAAERAMKYGVQLYYVPISPKLAYDNPLFIRLPEARGAKISPGLNRDAKPIHNLCSSHEPTLAFIGEVMANLFKEVPQLGGLNLIIGGESYYHCFMRPDKTGLAPGQKTNCPRCAGRTAEDTVNGLLKATAEAVHRQKPEAPVAAWPYSAFIWSSDPAQLELLRGMDPQVAFLNTIDKDEWAPKEGYRKKIWDYSIDYTGPASNLLKQADILNERGMDLFVKTETALGIECIQYPYMPSLQRLAEKWSHVASMNPKGVLQSWMFFGFWGSRAEELGWWTSWRPDKPVEEVLSAMAARDFGTLGPDMVRVWAKLSEAVSHLPYIANYFTGPEYIGPAHPLFFGDEAEKREEFQALLYYLQENEETFSTTVNEVKHSLVMEEVPHNMIRAVMRVETEEDYWSVFMREYELAMQYAQEAVKILEVLPESDDAVIQTSLTEEKQLCELVYRTFRSTVNTYKFLYCKQAGNRSGMLETAENEMENAKQARSIYIGSPWLDLSLRVDGKFPSSVRMIDTKIKIMKEEISLQR